MRMRRKERKGSVIRRVTHARTSRVGVVRLDKDGMMFFARDPDIDETPDTRGTIERFESKDGAAVEAWLYQRLSKNLKPDKPLDWLPVIEVEVGEGDRYYYRSSRRERSEERQTAVSAEMDRYYLALVADKSEWRKLKWHQLDPASSTLVAVEDQLSTSETYAPGPKAKDTNHDRVFALPSIREKKSVVAYTDELWAGLTQVFDNLDGTVKTIRDMLGTKKGLALIAEVGAGVKRLGSGDMTPTTPSGE